MQIKSEAEAVAFDREQARLAEEREERLYEQETGVRRKPWVSPTITLPPTRKSEPAPPPPPRAPQDLLPRQAGRRLFARNRRRVRYDGPLIIPAPKPYLQDATDLKPAFRRMKRWTDSNRWQYRQKNGRYDPLTTMLVLDALMNIELMGRQGDGYLRAADLAEYLNRTAPQLIWDAVTVGVTLTDIEEEAQGFLYSGTDSVSKHYSLSREAKIVQTAWEMRDYLMHITEREIALRAIGKKTDYSATGVFIEWARARWDAATRG